MGAEGSGGLVWALVFLGPVVFVASTSFAKVTLVLSAVRLGLSPRGLIPWSIVTALSLLLTVVIMSPTLEALVQPVLALWRHASATPLDELTGTPKALEIMGGLLADAGAPLQEFMSRHTDADILERVRETASPAETGIGVTSLAFLISQVTEGLAMAVMVLVPFVVVDLIIAQLLGIIGAGEQVSPHLALPAKIAVFLAAGGWTLLLTSLWESYR